MRVGRPAAVFLLLLVWIMAAGRVDAQVSCQVTATENYPQQVAPGASVTIATLVAGQCFSAFYTIDSYVVRVDITSPYSAAVLASNSAFTGYGSQTFSTTVSNQVTAPTSPTSWMLQVHVYVSVTGAGQPNYSSIDTITIQVGAPPTAPSTITTMQQTTIQPTTTSTQIETVYSSTIPPDTLEALAILLTIVAVALSFALMKTRKPREKTKVY